MNTKKLVAATIGAILGLTTFSKGESWLPYNTVNKKLVLVEIKKVDNKEFGAFYMKSQNGDKIDFKKADFRIETWAA